MMTTIDRLIRTGGGVLCAGGVLSAAAAIGQDFADDKAVNPAFTAVGVIGVLGGLLTLLGLPAFYAVQAHRAGRLGAIGFLLTFLGWAGLEVGTRPLYDFVAPALYARPGNADLAVDGALDEITNGFLWYVGAGLIALNLGLLLLGIATARAGVFPRWLGWAVAAGPIAIVLLGPVEQEVAGVLLGLLAYAGYRTATGRTAETVPVLADAH
ncbi:hypothetical protein [Actinoplanes palleronii]|uniref:DUF4386 family protein n=1 Tax=Actinoplanes palleronii TaxID=113570 RepID=A0ABQ4BPW0_9ACTN|nr:hypothetical protein [Actinoplanes palleronii]GIE72712.1 hypothetical protein Apa02nite_088200 [Actinoplanes palleronii]